MLSELTRIVHNIVLDNPVPAKALAKEIGKPYSTLLREINPYDTGAKLGVETLLQIMKCTGNIRPLEYMAEQMGCRLERDAKPMRALRMRENVFAEMRD